MVQCQRRRREDGGRRARITLAGKDVEDDVGGVEAVSDRFGARGLGSPSVSTVVRMPRAGL